jgi:hypothetical protein
MRTDNPFDALCDLVCRRRNAPSPSRVRYRARLSSQATDYMYLMDKRTGPGELRREARPQRGEMARSVRVRTALGALVIICTAWSCLKRTVLVQTRNVPR